MTCKNTETRPGGARPQFQSCIDNDATSRRKRRCRLSTPLASLTFRFLPSSSLLFAYRKYAIDTGFKEVISNKQSTLFILLLGRKDGRTGDGKSRPFVSCRRGRKGKMQNATHARHTTRDPKSFSLEKIALHAANRACITG